MKTKVFYFALLVTLSMFVSSCRKERTYIGIMASSDELKEISNETIKKAIQPSGSLGEVPIWLNVDSLVNEKFEVLYSGKIDGTSYTNGLHNRISSKLTIVSNNDQGLLEALVRINSSLQQLNDDSKLRALIIHQGLSTSSTEMNKVVEAIAEKKDRLVLLCVIGVDGDKRIATSAVFEPIRQQALVTSTLKGERKNCFSH